MQNYFSKKLFLFLLILSCSLVTKAQRQWLATVDPVSGTISKMDSIAGVRIYLGGYWPAYSEYSRRFTIGGGLSLSDPFYLFTTDAATGHTVNNPLLFTPPHGDFINFQYAKTGNVLYTTVNPTPQSPYSLATIDPVTAVYTILYDFPAAVNIMRLIPDEANNRLYVLAVPVQSGLSLLTIELSSGTVLSQVATPQITNLQYNYTTNTFYALANADAQPHAIYSLCTVNPVTGAITNLAAIPEVFNITWGSETLDENSGRYFFTSPAWGDTSNYLYTLDINNGNVLHKVVVPQYNVADKDNLAAIRYDNNVNKMYAMFWEAHTVDTPVVPPPIIPPVVINPIDSTCRMDIQTKLYSKALGHVLVVDKKVTTCKVSMNVYNMAGQVMLKNVNVNDGYNEIPLSNFATGIYYYKFISEGRMLLSGRFLKQ